MTPATDKPTTLRARELDQLKVEATTAVREYQRKSSIGALMPSYVIRDVPKDVIDAATARAHAEGRALADVLREYMTTYAGEKSVASRRQRTRRPNDPDQDSDVFVQRFRINGEMSKWYAFLGQEPPMLFDTSAAALSLAAQLGVVHRRRAWYLERDDRPLQPIAIAPFAVHVAQGLVLNCQKCGSRLTYHESQIGDSFDPTKIVHVFECATDGRMHLTLDGRLFPAAGQQGKRMDRSGVKITSTLRGTAWKKAVAALTAAVSKVDVEPECEVSLEESDDGRLDVSIIRGPVAINTGWAHVPQPYGRLRYFKSFESSNSSEMADHVRSMVRREDD